MPSYCCFFDPEADSSEKALKRKYLLIPTPGVDPIVTRFSGLNAAGYSTHLNGSRLSAAVHNFNADEIQRLKTKWEYE